MFYQMNDGDREKTKDILSKYGIPKDKKYILTVGALDQRKNLTMVINGFFDFLEKNKSVDDLYLVLSGPDRGYVKNMGPAVLRDRKGTRIIVTGYVDDEDINIIYNNAMFFVYLSLFEGFGLPILEAMQCGIPVISSNTSSMPEVYGDAAIGVDPRNRQEFVGALEKMYFDDDLREALASQGLERAKMFDWDKTTDIFIEEYRRIGGQQ
jgi:glycosyltransferase involved in cell wall biosynthesis